MTGRTPTDALAWLVSATRARADDPSDSDAIRAAFVEVLAELRVPSAALDAWNDGLDVPGSAYEALLSGEARRSAGQFFTPRWAARIMADWLLKGQPRTVLDAGCGSGSMLIALAESTFRGRSRLLGVDSDPVALRMAEVNALLRAIPRCDLAQIDFLRDEIPIVPDAVICNPPYSRHHALSSEAKIGLHEEFESRLGIRFSRNAGMHVLFLVRALELSAPDALLAFVTPSEWLDARYAREVRTFLTERARVEAIIALEGDHLLFPGVLTTASITLIRKAEPAGVPTRIVHVPRRLPSPAEVLAAVGGGTSCLRVEDVSLTETMKWSRPRAAKRVKGEPLANLARIRRGIATGANDFFVLTERDRADLGIPKHLLKPCLASPKFVQGITVTRADLDALPDGARRWLVDVRDVGAAERDDALGAYLRHGRDDLRVHETYLASERRIWHRQEQRDASEIVFTYLNRPTPRFVRNLAAAVPLNNWIVIEPKQGVDPDALFDSLQAPSIIGQLHEKRRIYGRGLWKVEPGELGQVRVTLGAALSRSR